VKFEISNLFAQRSLQHPLVDLTIYDRLRYVQMFNICSKKWRIWSSRFLEEVSIDLGVEDRSMNDEQSTT